MAVLSRVRIVFKLLIKSTFSILSYQKHLNSHKSESVGGTLEFMCDREGCGKKFRRRGELVRHLNLHDNNLEKLFSTLPKLRPDFLTDFFAYKNFLVGIFVGDFRLKIFLSFSDSC